ncbi:MAG: restriction endonuclease subunit S [Fusobacterium periodonticum]|nr:restriction endonuclease subunit S [Fusobacterium periodonticum]
MAKNNKVEISLEEKLKKALIPVDEQPYAIPSNWVWTRLGEVNEIITGNTPSKNENTFWENKDIFFVKPDDLSQGRHLSFSKECIDKRAVNKVRMLPKNTTLICCIGSIGKVAYSEVESCSNQQINSLVAKENCVYPLYNYYLVNSIFFQSQMLENSSATTISILNKSSTEKLLFPLPPLNEQKRIVEKLDFLFEKTKRAKEIIEEIKIDIENRKISILDRAFKGTLTSKWRNENKTSDVKELLKTINEEKIKKWEEDCLQAEKDGNKKPKKPIIKEVKDMIVPIDEQPYKLPDSWVWVRLGDIIRYTDNLDINKYYSDEQIINYVDIDSINNEFNYIEKFKKEKVKDLSSRARRILKKDFILYSSVRPYLNNFAIMKDEIEDCIGSTGFFVFRPIYINTLYIFRIFLVPYIKELYLASIKGFNSPSINVEIFNNTPIPLPPLEEQQEIVRVLDEVLENENKVKELLELEERIDILEKSILHKAFKGELGTQNSSDESAMELLKNIL